MTLFPESWAQRGEEADTRSPGPTGLWSPRMLREAARSAEGGAIVTVTVSQALPYPVLSSWGGGGRFSGGSRSLPDAKHHRSLNAGAGVRVCLLWSWILKRSAENTRRG